MLSFPTVGFFEQKFRDAHFYCPGKIQLSQPSLYDKIIIIIM